MLLPLLVLALALFVLPLPLLVLTLAFAGLALLLFLVLVVWHFRLPVWRSSALLNNPLHHERVPKSGGRHSPAQRAARLIRNGWKPRPFVAKLEIATMNARLKDNGLTLALIGLFAVSLIGQAAAGLSHENEELREHGSRTVGLIAYLGSGAFLSALFENWESEFLQMWAFVMLTAYLYQRGSPESKDPDKTAKQDRDPRLDENKSSAPRAVRLGGFVRAIYSHSLGLVLFGLFVASFVLHLVNSARLAADEGEMHGDGSGVDLLSHLGKSQFWFESFQNWQSEFLSTAVLIVLAIYLREKGSPESKPVSAPHGKTGTD